MLRQLNSSYLATLDEQGRASAWAKLAEDAKKANGEATAYLESRIRSFELRYEITSEELLRALEQDRIKETAEIAEWLFLLSALETHGPEARR